VIEEAYELLEGIRKQDPSEVSEELGDVLFLLLFIATLYEREGRFTFRDVVGRNAAKMIRRHPHVFGTARVRNQEELLANWERIKQGEKTDKEGKRQSLFSSLPANLPPLLKAYRINSKAARVGFTWEETSGVEEQLAREWQELQSALASGTQEEREEELGDYLFTLGRVFPQALDQAKQRAGAGQHEVPAALPAHGGARRGAWSAAGRAFVRRKERIVGSGEERRARASSEQRTASREEK
jgi:MazG family protein